MSLASEMRRIDVHAHLLPAVDDGCRDVRDSIACGRMLVDAGYSHAFCTPHVWPSLPNNTRDATVRAVDRLQRAYDDAGVSLRLFPGTEYNLDAMWPALRDLPRDEIVTYGMNGKHILFDFWAGSMRQCRNTIYPGIDYLRSIGLTPILAHPERVEALQREPAEIDRMIEMGVKLQLNSWCLAEPSDSPLYRTAVKLLNEDKYFLIGTDCHDSETLPVRIKGIRIATERFGHELVERLTMTNPRQLISSGLPG